MKRNSMKKMLSVLCCMVLAAALALSIAGCGSKEAPAGASFTFTVVDAAGAETRFEITTDKSTVGEALLEEGLIEGDQTEYGLYVKTVHGITADYDVDGTYWAFYIDGEYATTGVDATQVTDGASYSFKVEGGMEAPDETASAAGSNVLGEGAVVFTFIAIDLDGVETVYEIHTDAATVGDALLENSLIAGEDGEYGLYVKTVNGITLDWDTDGKYWSLLIDGEYAMTGVDMTEIVPGTTYTFTPAS